MRFTISLLTATQQDVSELLEKLRTRKTVRREAPKAEPLVELTSATMCREKQRIDNTWRNSPRELPIDPTADETFLVDLRYRFFISKLDLADIDPTQALPEGEPPHRVRQRFVLRAGQRYTRGAVPERLVEKVVRPLGDLVKSDAEVNRIFNEWSLFHGGRRGERPGVQAIYQLDIDETLDEDEHAEVEQTLREQAEDKFNEIIEALPIEAKDELDLDDDHRTQAIPENELTVASWRLSWKLEWDDESFGRDPDAALPAR